MSNTKGLDRTKSLREWNEQELRAELERLTGLPQPNPGTPDYLNRLAEWEVASHFLRAVAAHPEDPEKAKRIGAESALGYSASDIERIIPCVERAIGRKLDSIEIAECSLAA